jgi:arylsulfatase A-like enzyme
LAGVAPAEAVDGVPLLPLEDERGRSDRALFWREVAAERDGGGETWAVRHGRWKYLRESNGKESLFHLENDPGEKSDRSAAEPARRDELRARSEAWRRAVGARTAVAPATSR